ncbi:MAG: hypothetical protein M1829_004442 [Trizodia sp. TS-e1964]|nr:MAG: hypothetical protein M1829_004442 [Trizodia sp. TS-e1964]
MEKPSTDSMVTVRLSDAEQLSNLPSAPTIAPSPNLTPIDDDGDSLHGLDVRLSSAEISSETPESGAHSRQSDNTTATTHISEGSSTCLSDRSLSLLLSDSARASTHISEGTNSARISKDLTPTPQGTFDQNRLVEESGEFLDGASAVTHISDTAEVAEPLELTANISRSRSVSEVTSSSGGSGGGVDWDGLEKAEEQEPRDGGSDQSTAFLLARLEQENNALATNPKSGLSKAQLEKRSLTRSHGRPPSINYLKRLVTGPIPPSLRYSLLPTPPPMTELEFWTAVVQDYNRTAQCLPTLLSKKVRAGIPAPLRGPVWVSMSGAKDRILEEQYDRLRGESSPYESLIGKDIGRSFPGEELFKDPQGEGQRMLGNVLKCFSLYDIEIGYCQGLGLLVGPLLMHMAERDAFCVLVKLMENYNLKSTFCPALTGLHIRIYQLEQLLKQHLPQLSAHLNRLQIELAYISQWFLSFFAVTCPLPMLIRIYDVIFCEGASETLIRVSLSLMRRNEKRILACSEFDDVIQLLLSRGIWDTYGYNADELVNDFVGLSDVVTKKGLQILETNFNESRNAETPAPNAPPDFQATASRFLGRWTGSSSSAKSDTLSPSGPVQSRPVSLLRRTPSKQSMASTMNSFEGGSESSISTNTTDVTSLSQTSADCSSPKSSPTLQSPPPRKPFSNKDKDLHGQIEDLLTALSEMQREQALLANDLQREREEREEDRYSILPLLQLMRDHKIPECISEMEKISLGIPADIHEGETNILKFLEKAESRFLPSPNRSTILETKDQLNAQLIRAKELQDQAAARSQEFERHLNEKDQELSQLREQLKESRSRIQEVQREKQRLELKIKDIKDCEGGENKLREFRLGKEIIAPHSDETLLAELVNAKTAEAVAKQEAEESRAKLKSLRTLLGPSAGSPPVSVSHRASPSQPNIERSATLASQPGRAMEQQKGPASASSSVGGFWGSWGKRSISITTINT